MDVIILRVCKQCLIPKTLDRFWKRKVYKDGYSPRCKDCWSDKSSKDKWKVNNPSHSTIYYRKNIERVRQHSIKCRLKKQYNLTVEDYENLSQQQENVCKICHNVDETKRLSVDHCHTTGKIRGLLCDRCNKVLGMVDDNSEILNKMIEYLADSDTGFIANIDLIKNLYMKKVIDGNIGREEDDCKRYEEDI